MRKFWQVFNIRLIFHYGVTVCRSLKWNNIDEFSYLYLWYLWWYWSRTGSPEPDAKANWQWGRVGWMLADHRDGLSSSKFLAWSSIAQSVCQQEFSLLANRCMRPWVRILHSAEEDNLSPFDSNIACLCQTIEINNNKHVYRQRQVRKPTGSEVEWAECLLIIGTGCRVQVFSLILDSSVGLSAGIQSAGE